MKLISLISISKQRKQILNEAVKKFDNNFMLNTYNKTDVYKNIIGMPAHFSMFAYSVYQLIKGDPDALMWALSAKLNYDFVPFLRNIVKRKAALLSRNLRQNNVNDPKEINFAVKKIFIRNGMPLYPLLHPKGMKRIVENGTNPVSFETGLVYARTDKKDFFSRYKSYITKKINKSFKTYEIERL